MTRSNFDAILVGFCGFRKLLIVQTFDIKKTNYNVFNNFNHCIVAPAERSARMSTVRWEPRKSATWFLYHSLERHKISNLLKIFRILITLQIFEELDEECDELLLCLTAIAIQNLDQHLHRIRPSNMYPPDGFYPSGAYDDFLLEHNEMFKHKFRFRLEHYHQMLRAMLYEGKKKFSRWTCSKTR